jgi:glycerate dehydrogenase
LKNISKKFMHKIVVLDSSIINPGDLSWDGLKELGEVTVFDRTPSDKVAERLQDFDIFLTIKTRISAELLEQTTNLKYIGVMATGYDIIDLAAAKNRRITVTNIPAYGTNAVSQHAMALLLEITNQIGRHNQAVHNGRWTESRDVCVRDYPMIELAEKTMAIIGLGRIGLALARLARELGMRVTADRAHPNPLAPEWVNYLDSDKLLAEADVISLCCPLRESNAEMINRQSIEHMRSQVIIINISRGGLINEAALAAALRSGKVAAAGLDVVSLEPIRPENPLFTAPNCYFTPHIAWMAKETRQRLLDTAVENIRLFLAGTPVNVVAP